MGYLKEQGMDSRHKLAWFMFLAGSAQGAFAEVPFAEPSQTSYVARQVPVSGTQKGRWILGSTRGGHQSLFFDEAGGYANVTALADSSHSWKEVATLSSTAVIHDLSFVNAQVGYAAGEHGLIWRTANSGTQWSVALSSGYNDYWYGVQALNANDLVITGFYLDLSVYRAILRWSHDGGSTWSDEVVLNQSDYANRVYFRSNVEGLVMGQANPSFEVHAFVSTSGGALTTDWSTLTIDPDQGWFGSQFSALPNGHVRASGVKYCESANTGASWTCIPSVDAVFDGETFFLDDNIGWVAAGSVYPQDEGWVHRTVDGGKTWSDRTLDAPWPIRQLLFVDAQHGWAAGGVGNAGGIYFSADGGQTWSLDVDSGAEMDACANVDFVIFCAGYDASFAGHVYRLDYDHVFVDGFEGSLPVGQIRQDN
jgi:photosystem II stability/assembly factor-like uncharacterized protein